MCRSQRGCVWGLNLSHGACAKLLVCWQAIDMLVNVREAEGKDKRVNADDERMCRVFA